MFAAPGDGHRLRGRAQTADGEGFLLHRGVDQCRHLSTDTIVMWFQQVDTEAHGGRRVDRVAALFHDPEPGRGGEVMARRHDAATSHDDWTGGEGGHGRERNEAVRSQKEECLVLCLLWMGVGQWGGVSAFWNQSDVEACGCGRRVWVVFSW